MYNKILVALDSSEMGKQVFEQALALAKATGADLMLLHVLSAEEEGSPYLPSISSFDYYPGVRGQSFEVYQKQWDKFKNECLEMLQSLCAKANTAGINTEFTQNVGSPGRTICDLALSWGADLIIMGRRGRSGLTEIFLGSVSNYVLHHAPCSVHILHPKINVKKPEVAKESITTNGIS
jgi:nucleotide-binding universal stress UspA family protein